MCRNHGPVYGLWTRAQPNWLILCPTLISEALSITRLDTGAPGIRQKVGVQCGVCLVDHCVPVCTISPKHAWTRATIGAFMSDSRRWCISYGFVQATADGGTLPPPPPLAHARPCLSTGWALNRRFEEILGPLFLWSRMEGWVFVEYLYRERGAQSCL